MSEMLNMAVAVLLIIVSVGGVILNFQYRRLQKENQTLRDTIIARERAWMGRLQSEGIIETYEPRQNTKQEVQQ